MILHCSFEEVTALRHGGRTLLTEGAAEERAVAAPPPSRLVVEELLDHLDGDLSVGTLAEQRRIERAVEVIATFLRSQMEERVVATHPADEGAVASYFEYAHTLSVLDRLQEMGGEMRALIEVMTGRPPDQGSAREIVFPD